MSHYHKVLVGELRCLVELIAQHARDDLTKAFIILEFVVGSGRDAQPDGSSVNMGRRIGPRGEKTLAQCQ